MYDYFTRRNLEILGIISVFLFVVYQNRQLKDKAKIIGELFEENRVQKQQIDNLQENLQDKTSTINQKEAMITSQSIEIENKTNKIQEQNTQIQNLNNDLRNQSQRIEEKEDQIRNSQARLQQKEKSHQDEVQSLKNQVIKVNRQHKNMIMKITQELDTEIVAAIRQGVTDVIKEYLNHFNEQQDQEECI